MNRSGRTRWPTSGFMGSLGWWSTSCFRSLMVFFNQNHDNDYNQNFHVHIFSAWCSSYLVQWTEQVMYERFIYRFQSIFILVLAWPPTLILPSVTFSGRGWPWTEWWMRLTRRSVRGSWLVHHHSQSLFDLKQSHQTAVSLSPINAKQVTSEWGSYLRSYKLDQDILPGGQISPTAETSPYGSTFKRWVNFASYATGWLFHLVPPKKCWVWQNP